MKLKKIIACLLALTLLCTAIILPASAETDYREAQLKRFQQMQSRKISVAIDHSGGYVMKSTKFYAREVVGVDEVGNFILGPRKCLDSGTNEPMFTHRLQANGTCVAFAYSCDIVWGTDFPYSGIFWNDPNQDVSSIEINLSGPARMVILYINVNGKCIFQDNNCSSHSEWKP